MVNQTVLTVQRRDGKIFAKISSKSEASIKPKKDGENTFLWVVLIGIGLVSMIFSLAIFSHFMFVPLFIQNLMSPTIFGTILCVLGFIIAISGIIGLMV